ncbi:hypothetical protein [Streptomyces drozdowiczii]
MRFNWNKRRPASYWKHDVIGYLFLAAVTLLLWWVAGTPWWIACWFVINAFVALLRMLERPPSKPELVVADEVTVVQATAVSIRRFRG